VTSFEVQSVNNPSPNILETFIGEQTVKVPFTPDTQFLANNGNLQYCIKRLEHKDFQYKITIVWEHFDDFKNGCILSIKLLVF